MRVWRVYCHGRDFGTDYPTRDAAQAVRDLWQAMANREWPHKRLRYTVRGINRA